MEEWNWKGRSPGQSAEARRGRGEEEAPRGRSWCRPPEWGPGPGARGGVFRELEISRPRCPGGQPRPGLKRLGFGDTRPFMTWTKAVIFCW